jgi:1,6-anhydro-N-acetylmuramate kinase
MPPKSTGRDLFNMRLAGRQHPGAARRGNWHRRDVQATLAELTARGLRWTTLLRRADKPAELIVCGGGRVQYAC